MDRCRQNGARGAEERAHQDGRHLVWAVPGNTEEGRREGVPTLIPAEREAFLRMLMEIDADDAKDGQSPPSNPTPV